MVVEVSRCGAPTTYYDKAPCWNKPSYSDGRCGVHTDRRDPQVVRCRTLVLVNQCTGKWPEPCKEWWPVSRFMWCDSCKEAR